MRLCCIFNYAPLYRQCIYKKIDDCFDAEFYFGEEVISGRKSGIAKLDYSIFKHKPKEFKNSHIFKFSWRTGIAFLPFKKYDTFLITGDFTFSYLPLLFFAKLRGKKVYGWGHGLKKRGGKLGFLLDFLHNNLDGFFTYGEGGAKRLKELYPNLNIAVIYNSLVDKVLPADLKSDIFKEHFGNDEPVLLFIGRLTPEKKLDWLIDAHAALNRNGHTCNLALIGTGAKEQELKAQAAECGFGDRVWFYGECYDDMQNKYLIYNSDLCVSPGNVGLTALNCLQYGTPVISHDNFEVQMPEYEVIKPYETGLLYKYGDKEDFLRKINEWFDYASERREEIRRNCYDMINGKWNANNQIEVLKNVFERK